MSKIWLIAKDEFRRNVYKKSFILALLSVPLMLAFNIGIGLIVENLYKDSSPIGFVDHSGLLDHPISVEDQSDPVPMIAFDPASRRLGDRLAGTIVVHERSAARPLMVQRMPAGWGRREVAVVESLLRREATLEAGRAARLADRIVQWVTDVDPAFLAGIPEQLPSMERIRRAFRIEGG